MQEEEYCGGGDERCTTLCVLCGVEAALQEGGRGQLLDLTLVEFLDAVVRDEWASKIFSLHKSRS